MLTISKQSEGWDTELIRKIKTSLTAKLFLATTVLLILVCLLSVFSMARYIPQTYSNRLSAELQKQANDLVPVLEKAGSLEECYSLVQQFTAQTKATAYIEDDYGDILYSSDKLTIATDKDSIATIQENPDSTIITNDELLTEAGYVFTLLGSDYTFMCKVIRCPSIRQQRRFGKPFRWLYWESSLCPSCFLSFTHAI